MTIMTRICLRFPVLGTSHQEIGLRSKGTRDLDTSVAHAVIMTIDLEQCRKNFKHRLALHYAQRESLRQQVREQAIVAILEVIPRYPQIIQVYLFGSVTRPGGFSDRSDLDIAVAGTDAASYFALWGDLETACPDWCIDLREINQACHFTDTVRQTGELIYDSSRQYCYSQSES